MRQQVRQPCDGVRFAAPCGVLDEVVVPNPLRYDIIFAIHGLRQADGTRGKTRAVCFTSLTPPMSGVVHLFCGLLLVDEVVNQLHQVIAL